MTAPEGENKVEAADPLFTNSAAALAQGFAVQTFFIPILKQNSNIIFYKKLLGITYFVGVIVYSYIGYSGAFGTDDL